MGDSLPHARLAVLCGLAMLGAVASPARAERQTLRVATIAPDGTAWARELKAMGNEVEQRTGGEVRIKFYFGGIAGDDVQVGARVKRGQLDGVGSGGMLCQQLAPSWRVMMLPGVFQSRAESSYVIGRLKSTLDGEFERSGFVNLALANMGPSVVFSRTPIRSLSELRATKIWVWELNDVQRRMFGAMGLKPIVEPLEAAGRAYETGRVDGFIAIPTAALAFQWSSQARFVSDLRTDFLIGCFVVARRAFDVLPHEQQRILRGALGKLTDRWEEIGRQQDAALLGGLFERQGVKRVVVSDTFRSEFLDAARGAREQLGDQLLAPGLLRQVLVWLADYRAEHSGPETEKN